MWLHMNELKQSRYAAYKPLVSRERALVYSLLTRESRMDSTGQKNSSLIDFSLVMIPILSSIRGVIIYRCSAQENTNASLDLAQTDHVYFGNGMVA